MAEKLEFDLKVGSNELTKAISDATTGSKKLGDTISTALGTFGGNLALKGFELLGRAVGNTTDFILDSVDAAAEQESAFNKLAQSLRITGEFSQDAIQDFSDFATQLQRTSVFGDEVVISQIAIAKSLGATNDQAKQLVQAAANLSATFGGSLEENVFKLGKTLGGVVSKELKVIIPEIRSLSEEAIRSGAALKIVNDRFGGAASSELNTYAGGTTALKNAFSDLQEEIGSFVTGSTTVNTIIKGLTGTFQSLTGAVFGFRKEFQGISSESETNKKKISDLGNEYNRLKDAIDQARKPVFDLNAALSTKQALQASGVKNIAEAEIRLSQILKERVALRTQLNAIESKAADTPKARGDDSTAQEIQKIKELEAQKTQLVTQSELERQDALVQIRNIQIEDEFARQAAEIQRITEFETQKRELEFQLAEEKAALNADKDLGAAELAKIQKERELAFTQIGNKALIAEEQNNSNKKKALILQQQRFEQQTLQNRLGYIQAFGNLASAVAKDGSKEQFLIQKAAAIGSSIVATQLAAAQALAIPPAPNLALSAVATKIGLINTAAIAATAIKGFAEGGIVGATRGGDDQIAKVRTGEMVLNADQQKSLFDMIKSGTMNQGNIVIEIDGREIMKVVRNQVRSGYSIA